MFFGFSFELAYRAEFHVLLMKLRFPSLLEVENQIVPVAPEFYRNVARVVSKKIILNVVPVFIKEATTHQIH